MSEEIKEEAQQTVVQNPFDDKNWKEPGSEEIKEEKKEEVIEEKKEEVKKEEEEILDPKDYLKREYGWESPEDGKKELEELRALRAAAKTPEEIKFANDASKQFFDYLKEGKEEDVYSFLDKKRKLSTADKMDAASAIKLNITLKNEHYTPEEVNDLFNEQYSYPKKPVQYTDETDDDFNERVKEHEETVARINRKIERDAKDAKLSLAQMSTELVLPDIPTKTNEPAAKKEPTPQELEEAKKFKDEFLKVAAGSVQSFNGFSTAVKDKDVDFTVAYGTSDDEKQFLSKQIQAFTESGFDANVLFAGRWLNEDKTINTTQMIKDLSLVENADKVMQKIASEAANQRLEEYLKTKKKIDVNEQKQNGTFTPDKDGKTEMQNLQEFFWNQS